MTFQRCLHYYLYVQAYMIEELHIDGLTLVNLALCKATCSCSLAKFSAQHYETVTFVFYVAKGPSTPQDRLSFNVLVQNSPLGK